jgi:hypothetical protein
LRIQKVLEDANLKLGSVLADVLGGSGRAILKAIISGEDDPVLLAALAQGHARRKTSEMGGKVREDTPVLRRPAQNRLRVTTVRRGVDRHTGCEPSEMLSGFLRRKGKQRQAQAMPSRVCVGGRLIWEVFEESAMEKFKPIGDKSREVRRPCGARQKMNAPGGYVFRQALESDLGW